MQRIFGTSSGGGGGGGGSKKPAKPTIQDAINSTDTRTVAIDEKIAKLDTELRKYKDQLKKMPPGPAKNTVQQRALKILQQKRLYEGQKDQLMQQSFNMEQTTFVTENLKNTMLTVEVMQQTNKDMKKQFKKIDLNKLEKVRDEMEDLMEEANEIQEVMSRSYDTDVIDEDDLEAELAALGDEVYEPESEPSYLTDSAPTVPTDPISQRTAGTTTELDEFGLPMPMKQ